MAYDKIYGRIITGISIIVILLGLSIAFLLDPTLVPVNEGVMVKWLLGIIGATLMGWGMTILLVSWYAFRQGIPHLIRYILIGLVAWFIPDTLISAYFNVTFNVIVNIIFLLLAGIPLYLSQKALDGKTKIFAWD